MNDESANEGQPSPAPLSLNMNIPADPPPASEWNAMRWRMWAFFALITAGLAVWYVSRPRPSGPAEGTAIEGQAADGWDRARTTFRIGTLNIHGAVGKDDRRDLNRVADCVRDLDFSAMNEVHGPRYWESEDQAALLGKQLGQGWLFAPASWDLYRREFGNAFLTNMPVESWQRIPLKADNGRGYRNMVLAEVRLAERTVHILLTHVVRGDSHTRQKQLAEVVDRFLELEEPAVLLGDLNSEADYPEIRRLLETPGVVDAVGQKVGAVPGRIDWIFVRGLKVVDASLYEHEASDHPLAWAELE